MQPMRAERETPVETKKVLGVVPEAENLTFTNDGRLLISGGDGLYEVDPEGRTPVRRIPIAFDRNSSPSLENRAIFLGLTQCRHFVYASCTHSLEDPKSPRYIMFMDTTQSSASMVAIHKMENEGFFNGMAADSEGNLYLADGGKIIPPKSGKLVKLRLSSPTTVAERSDWLASEGGRPNGVKIDGDTLYFSEEPLLFFVGDSHVKKVRIKADGAAGVVEKIYSRPSGKLLDDIELVEGGLLVTQTRIINRHSRIGNKVIHISEDGAKLHETQVALALPSAVKLVPDAESSPSPDFIVTERGDAVSRISQDWGLKPRRVNR